MRWKTWLKVLAGIALALLIVVGVSLLVLRSQWFYEKVRLKVIDTVETATGGKVAVGGFSNALSSSPHL